MSTDDKAEAECRMGHYCGIHECVHGGEAEELRQKLELLESALDESDARAVREILDNTDARDSLAFLEQQSQEGVEKKSMPANCYVDNWVVFCDSVSWVVARNAQEAWETILGVGYAEDECCDDVAWDTLAPDKMLTVGFEDERDIPGGFDDETCSRVDGRRNSFPIKVARTAAQWAALCRNLEPTQRFLGSTEH